MVAETKRSDGQNYHAYGDLYRGKIIAEFCGSQQQEFIGCWIPVEDLSEQANDHPNLVYAVLDISNFSPSGWPVCKNHQRIFANSQRFAWITGLWVKKC